MKRFLSIFLATVMTLVCGVLLTACGGDNGGDSSVNHTHTYAEAWSSDDNYHWHAATCEHSQEVSGKEAHTWGDLVVDTPSTETVKGSGHRVCSVCSKSGASEVIDYSDGVDFNPNDDVTLLFDVRGGTEITPVTFKAGTTVDLTKYNVENGGVKEFDGWEVNGKVVNSFVIKKDTVAHAVFDTDNYSGNVIALGKYPQKVVSDFNVIEALNKLTEPQANGYYLLNGVEYAKQEFVAGSMTRYNKSSDGSVTFKTGETYWFKVEPVYWKYDAGRYTTTKVIDNMAFTGDTFKSGLNDGYYAWCNEQGYNAEVRDNDYKFSSIRYYLNEIFYKNNLTAAEQSALKNKTVGNNVKSYDGSALEYTYNDVADKIYLWDRDEYFQNHTGTAEARYINCTDYALARGCAPDVTDTQGNGKRFTTTFWFYNPVKYNNENRYDDNEVKVSDLLDESRNARTLSFGLRPCISVKQAANKSGEAIRVTFNTNGGTLKTSGGKDVNSVAIIAGKTYDFNALYVPEKDDYRFDGWYSDEALTKKANGFNENATVYAKYKPAIYSISYELNGGYFRNSSDKVEEFTSKNVVTFAEPKKDETESYTYAFDGWYLEPDFQTKVTTSEGLKKDITLHAKWIENGIYFNITYTGKKIYNSDDMVMPQEYPTRYLKSGEKIQLPVPTKEGYAFIGWEYRDFYGSYRRTLELDPKDNTKFSGDIEFTAVFEEAYTITWDLDGGTIEGESDLTTVVWQGHEDLDFTKIVAPEKEGLKFIYWSVVGENGSASKYGKNYTTTISFGSGYSARLENLTITAVYSTIKRIHIVAAGGTPENMTVEVWKENGIAFDNPVRENNSVQGYYYDETLTGSTCSYITLGSEKSTVNVANSLGYNSTYFDNIADDVTFYVAWNKVTVSFETGADDVTVDPYTGNYNETYTLPTPVRSGYRFDGWFKTAETDDSKYTELCLRKDTTLYAKWTASLTVTVLKAENGDVLETRALFPGDALGTFNEGGLNLSEENYVYGWKNTDGSYVYSTTKVSGDMTVYPVIKKCVVVTIDYKSSQTNKKIYLKQEDKIYDKVDPSVLSNEVEAVDGKYNYGWYVFDYNHWVEVKYAYTTLTAIAFADQYDVNTAAVTIYTKWYDNLTCAGTYYGFSIGANNSRTTDYDYATDSSKRKYTVNQNGWVWNDARSNFNDCSTGLDEANGRLNFANKGFAQYAKCGEYEFLLFGRYNSNYNYTQVITDTGWEIDIVVKCDSVPAAGELVIVSYGKYSKEIIMKVGEKTFKLKFTECTANQPEGTPVLTVTEQA